MGDEVIFFLLLFPFSYFRCLNFLSRRFSSLLFCCPDNECPVCRAGSAYMYGTYAGLVSNVHNG